MGDTIGKIKDTIDGYSNNDNISIEQKIELILDYIHEMSRYSFRNRRIAQNEFMKWILTQNVKSIHLAEKL